ncbi:glutathione ABC transporter substrate-binding protein [Ammoniphilus sp. CFH 90114]|uniref:glutathione ABC transporter substrate-binding protein n=1 Tax=Ammoniphilus sp. CFH 90114 TaxID=2493665 RepID=UPI00100FD215|nr:glutathione ABC transporter substrate-binding protein [Ammoniphilus sp. CFH 90114]RXT04338.1 glutathione ABC transporter substrate-binding protein [Ammoniphilus sp. CFH 90114]
MIKNKWVKRTLACFVATSVFLVGCSKTEPVANTSTGGTETASPAKPSEFIVAQDANPTTMDPQDSQENVSYSITKTMYEGLLDFDRDMKMHPVLAESMPEMGEDAKSLTFKLKKGIKFHDGTDFNAEAVKANIDRLKNPENRLKRASLFAAVESVEVVDEYTAKVILNKPFAAIVQTFAHPSAAMISPKAIAENNKGLNRAPVGTGRYKFVEWKDAQHTIVEKFDGYWDAANAAKVDRIVFKPVPEAASRVAMLKTGEAHFVYPLPPEQTEAVKGDNNIIVEKSPSLFSRYVAFNVTKEPFDDKLVRQALNYAVDKEALVKVVMRGFASPAQSVVSPMIWGFQKQQMYDFNLEKAKQLLAEAGHPNGFETTIWVDNSTEKIKIAEFIQQQWKQIGVNANVQPMEEGTLSNQMYVEAKDSKMLSYATGWSPSTGEIDWGVRPLLTKDNFPPAGYNVGYYTNEEVEKNIALGLSSNNEQERLAAYAEAQKTIVEDAPWLFMFAVDNVLGKRANIDGAFVMPGTQLDVKGVEFK